MTPTKIKIKPRPKKLGEKRREVLATCYGLILKWDEAEKRPNTAKNGRQSKGGM